MTFQKWHTAWNKKQKETSVPTVVKSEKKEEKTPEPTIAPVEEKTPSNVLWTIWGSVVKKPIRWITFEAKVAPVPMFKLPEHLQKYLINKWFGTNVWKRDKEWLEKHWADMEMIEELKRFLSQM